MKAYYEKWNDYYIAINKSTRQIAFPINGTTAWLEWREIMKLENIELQFSQTEFK